MLEPLAYEAYEEVRGEPDAPLVLTCEHASARLPAPWLWSAEDVWLRGTHWAYDLGARALTLELAEALAASAVLARFTRLLVDPNRALTQEGLFREQCEGRVVQLNAALTEHERNLRLMRYYQPYHAAVDRMLAECGAELLLSIHSFTTNYEGAQRSVEIGVLFNHEGEHARALYEALSGRFANVAQNEPWSGKSGLIYSAESHAERFGRVALELEVRQDRLENAAYRAKLVPVLAAFVKGRFSAR